MQTTWRRWIAGLSLLVLLNVGCTSSSKPNPPPSTSGSPTTDLGTPSETLPGDTTATGSVASSDPLAVEIMTEVDGIPIPRIKTEAQSLQLTGALPADVGNEHAKGKAGEKVTGDALVIRFNSEPKVMNPITETSAVMHYIGQYVQEALLWQNPETFEFEPHMASKWVREDSIKLSPDTPGKKRRLQRDGQGEPAATVDVEYVAPPKGDEKAAPMKIDFTTLGDDDKPLGNVWVGVFPLERIVGAPSNGYHLWSDAAGKVALSGMPTGKYTVKVAAEVFGKSTLAEDGTLTVTAATEDNPLVAELKAANKTELVLPKGEWIDRQQETYTTLDLRDDVKWSDGEPFTTRDLEFAFAAINNPTVDGDSIRTYYSDVIECTAIGPHRVRMRYRQQYFKSLEFVAGLGQMTPPFHFFAKLLKENTGKDLTLERLTAEQEAAQKKISAHGAEFGKFFNNDPTYNRAPLGTGQYVFSRWETGDRVELVRNPNYWLPKRAAYLDKIIVKFIPDNVTAMQALKAGEIDFFYSMTPEQYFEDLKGPPDWFSEKYVKAAWFTPMFYYFGWNMQRPALQDRRVRIALGMLFDKQDFVKEKLFNEAALVSGTQYYFGPGYDHSVPPLGYDPDAARDLLAEAGWVDTDNDGVLDKDGQPMKFVVPVATGNPVVMQALQLFQKSAQTAGISVEIRPLEWASYIDKIKAKDFDICMMRWAMPIESDPYQIWHSSGAGKESRGSNHVSFDNPQADELIERLRLTLDDKQRQKVNFAFHRLLDREQPYNFVCCPKDFGAYHQRFRGVKWYRIRPGFDLTEWYVPKDEQLRN
ncbi:MAG TPA: ABC transporter substrate-binding protein [Planctomycetaceae bacterium]|nr:ABC transporter substrate-binding protein [Planctomycetaceae bacterium]